VSALAQGAVACLASRPLSVGACIVVNDTIEAFQRIALAWRNRQHVAMLALTGSNGKTTVKEMLRTILIAHHEGAEQRVLATQGNLNNHLGVPMMLARLNTDHRHAVIEAGMNHFREISVLTRLIRPEVALINNAGPAHLEGVGDLNGVARAKGEIFEGLIEGGTAVLNADDPYFDYWRRLLHPSHKVISFGQHAKAVVRGVWQDVAHGATMHIEHEDLVHSIDLPLVGTHNRMNALAATAGALALGVPVNTSARALAQFAPVQGRQVEYTLASGAIVIDDTYNANPASVQAAMDSLGTRVGSRVLVLGQLAELGTHSEELHAQIGQWVAHSSIETLLATGERMRAAVSACNAISQKAQWFEDKEKLTAALRPMLKAHTCVLIKGSRSSAMEQVVQALAPQSQKQGVH
jgi:UDP-N-acetylmuramoyl-tripeptide--D-alanyl-D-alanine ligase